MEQRCGTGYGRETGRGSELKIVHFAFRIYIRYIYSSALMYDEFGCVRSILARRIPVVRVHTIFTNLLATRRPVLIAMTLEIF